MADLVAVDRLEPGLIDRFRATLGPWLAPVPDGTAPLGAHWCLFPPLAATDTLGPDGHPPRLHAVPETPFPRRMWVGGELTLSRPFAVGVPIERHSSLRPLAHKQGSAGPFILTGLDHRYRQAGETVAVERQDIVYRPPHSHPAAALSEGGPSPEAESRCQLETSPALLLRYSAVTFNAHRIHFDHTYATEVEGHEGLLVHGPLQATILLNLIAPLASTPLRLFRYRAVAPLVAGRDLIATARRTPAGILGTVHDRTGRLTLSAEAHA